MHTLHPTSRFIHRSIRRMHLCSVARPIFANAVHRQNLKILFLISTVSRCVDWYYVYTLLARSQNAIQPLVVAGSDFFGPTNLC
ncbi:hypothetical protein RSOLAG1IB_09768 [Rhizoctonia solani AG-1 IB]|uniref:Uncharacterized protein n=1 Tax=Thanatephorus cucumeris (strain AG1-IB / isolate 7/3/14) TaxID=1108050 RepID=A0A0B7FY80_THACB|nr:hypothetical protein RSOLAG1IB_09768 [Rhizoctonia solani AG-1 IB]